jgi:hypothetical protein
MHIIKEVVIRKGGRGWSCGGGRGEKLANKPKQEYAKCGWWASVVRRHASSTGGSGSMSHLLAIKYHHIHFIDALHFAIQTFPDACIPLCQIIDLFLLDASFGEEGNIVFGRFQAKAVWCLPIAARAADGLGLESSRGGRLVEEKIRIR